MGARRRLVPAAGQLLRPGQARTMMWTTNGFPNPLSVLPAAGKPLPGSARGTVVLVLTRIDLSDISQDLQLTPEIQSESYSISFSPSPLYLPAPDLLSLPQSFTSSHYSTYAYVSRFFNTCFILKPFV